MVSGGESNPEWHSGLPNPAEGISPPAGTSLELVIWRGVIWGFDTHPQIANIANIPPPIHSFTTFKVCIAVAVCTVRKYIPLGKSAIVTWVRWLLLGSWRTT